MVSHRDGNGQNIAKIHTPATTQIFTIVTVFVVKRDSAYHQLSVNNYIGTESQFSSKVNPLTYLLSYLLTYILIFLLTLLLTFLLTYLLTLWCRLLFEKITGLKLIKKCPAFHGTRRFISAFTSVRRLSLSWASPIQSI